MKTVVLDCKKFRTRIRGHKYLAKTLEFPDYYGNNLDALYDCLTELGQRTVLLKNTDVLRDSDCYGAKILRVIEDAANNNPNILLTESEDDE